MYNNRNYSLDILRIAAICTVVFMHTLTGAMDIMNIHAYPTYRPAILLIMDLVTWCVPVFLMISGYIFLDPHRKTDFRTMMGKYGKRILIALFLFGIPFACLEWITVNQAVRMEMVWGAFLMVLRGQGWAHMWYLYLIFFLYLITPPLKKLLSLVPRYTIYIGMGILLVLCSLAPFVNQVLGQLILPMLPGEVLYLCYYLFGYLMVNQKNSTIIKERRFRFLLPLVLLAGVIIGMFCSRIIGAFQLQMAYNYPPVVLMSVLIMWITVRMEAKHSMERQNESIPIKDSRQTMFKWEQLASLSFTIYLIHPLFINIFYKYLGFSPFDFPLYGSLPLFFIATLALSVVGAWLLRKVPVLKKNVL